MYLHQVDVLSLARINPCLQFISRFVGTVLTVPAQKQIKQNETSITKTICVIGEICGSERFFSLRPCLANVL